MSRFVGKKVQNVSGGTSGEAFPRVIRCGTCQFVDCHGPTCTLHKQATDFDQKCVEFMERLVEGFPRVFIDEIDSMDEQGMKAFLDLWEKISPIMFKFETYAGGPEHV